MIQLDAPPDLDGIAAGWAVRIDRGLSAEEQAQLDAWVGADLRRQGALIRAMAVLAAMGAPSAPANDAAPVQVRHPGRRLLVGGAVAAGLAGLMAVIGGQIGSGQVHATRRGQRRTVTLADGSRVWLNGASQVRVSFSPARRDITLLAGEALFDVAKDPARPFVVRSGAVEVRAVGTSFSVGELPDRPVEIMVREGYVDVAAETAGAAPATRLRPGCRAQATQAGDVAVRHVGVAAVLQALSWRQGVLDFQAASLADASLIFARQAGPRIVVDTPDLAGQTITGQYRADDPEAFARAAAQTLNLRVAKADGVIHLRR